MIPGIETVKRKYEPITVSQQSPKISTNKNEKQYGAMAGKHSGKLDYFPQSWKTLQRMSKAATGAKHAYCIISDNYRYTTLWHYNC